MCGIAGYINLNGDTLMRAHAEPVLRGMGSAMESRGPDDTQLMLWRNVGFVFKRLSIVDIDGGRQPFEVEDGRICAMTNGEIYNHHDIRSSLRGKDSLHTRSDCEVIPYLYHDKGLRLFDAVNGMFATAILDKQQGRVLLARDRVGIKPLFYCVTPDRSALVFASELKALFAHDSVPRNFDWDRALSFVRTRSPVARDLPTFFKDIERVPAAHILELRLADGHITVQPYWQPPSRDEGQQGDSARDYIARFREVLEDSVRLRLMSDVQCGVFLSGGVDSAAVAALASRYQDLPTFSVSSISTVGSGDVEAAQQVAAHVGLTNHQVFLDTGEGVLTPDHWREVLWSCEFHLAGAEQLYKYYLHAFARQRYPDLKVMLLGQGIDEYAGGYMEWMLGERKAWTAADWPRLDRAMQQLERDGVTGVRAYPWGYDGLVYRPQASSASGANPIGHPSGRSTLDLYHGYCRENLDLHLWHEDRTASAHSIESRVPYLDHRLVELIARVPLKHHAALFMDKAILREAVIDILPVNIARRPKGYFYYGKQQGQTYAMMHSLLLANDRELIEQAIAGSEATNGPIDATKLHDYVSRVGRTPSVAACSRLQELVNMGLLADMARSSGPAGCAKLSMPAREIDGTELQQMISTVRATVPAELKFIDQMVPKLAPGAGLSADGKEVTLPDGSKIAVASSGWSKFLTAMDGKQTVGDIIYKLGLPKSRTVRQLRSSMNDGVIIAAHI